MLLHTSICISKIILYFLTSPHLLDSYSYSVMERSEYIYSSAARKNNFEALVLCLSIFIFSYFKLPLHHIFFNILYIYLMTLVTSYSSTICMGEVIKFIFAFGFFLQHCIYFADFTTTQSPHTLLKFTHFRKFSSNNVIYIYTTLSEAVLLNNTYSTFDT